MSYSLEELGGESLIECIVASFPSDTALVEGLKEIPSGLRACEVGNLLDSLLLSNSAHPLLSVHADVVRALEEEWALGDEELTELCGEIKDLGEKVFTSSEQLDIFSLLPW